MFVVLMMMKMVMLMGMLAFETTPRDDLCLGINFYDQKDEKAHLRISNEFLGSHVGILHENKERSDAYDDVRTSRYRHHHYY